VNPVAIDPLSTFGMNPVDLVHLAADLGCEQVGMQMRNSLRFDPPFYPDFSVKDDPALPGRVRAALKERELSLSFVDGFLIEADKDIRDRARDLAIAAELGAPMVNTVSIDPDPSRSIDQFGVLVDLAASEGLQTTLELVPLLHIKDLTTALATINAVGRHEFRLLVDTMHFGRAGITAAEVATLDPRLLAYVQISDVKVVPDNPDYWVEATTERLVPGAGELDLVGLLSAVPETITISVEAPMYAAARAGRSPHERLGPCVAATRELLRLAHAHRPPTKDLNPDDE
jgi:sugar phosphate isomerase/epimerase